VEALARGSRLKVWNTKPDLFVADPRQFIVGQIAHLLTVEPVFAPVGVSSSR